MMLRKRLEQAYPKLVRDEPEQQPREFTRYDGVMLALMLIVVACACGVYTLIRVVFGGEK